MLEVVVSKSLEENFRAQCGGGTLSYDSICHLAIHRDGGPKHIMDMNMMSTFWAKGNITVLHRLAEFTLLKMLDHEDCKEVQNYHVKYICWLFLLRFLSLRNTNLPTSVTTLERLEYLFFSEMFSWRRWEIPVGLERMMTLRMLGTIRLPSDPNVVKEIAFKFPALKNFSAYPCATPRAIRFEKPAMEKVETFTVFFRDNGGTGRPILPGIENLTSLKKLVVLTRSRNAEIKILERLNVESVRHQNNFQVAAKYL
uniref:Disease resistance R13L4/SHOC-2-like LRR domain-containing protein n=1 Tax=Oryza glumipatula TaxID=40148 RepID=A0A0D9YQW0_9ORYZ